MARLRKDGTPWGKGAPPIDPRRLELVESLGLSSIVASKLWAMELDQLEKCADESAQRVLLGIGRPFDA